MSQEITGDWKTLHDQAYMSVEDHMTRAINFVYDDHPVHPVMKKLSEESKIQLVKCLVDNATTQWHTSSKCVMMQRALPKWTLVIQKLMNTLLETLQNAISISGIIWSVGEIHYLITRG